MSAASFISMAGSLYALGYDGLGYVLGWTGGYVLVAILLAPYLRKFGIFTVPDFLGTRYEGHLPRLLGIIVLFCASFTYIVAQIVGVGIVTSRSCRSRSAWPSSSASPASWCARCWAACGR